MTYPFILKIAELLIVTSLKLQEVQVLAYHLQNQLVEIMGKEITIESKPGLGSIF
jgi:hypothetical protein